MKRENSKMTAEWHSVFIVCGYTVSTTNSWRKRNALLLFRITTLATVDSYPSNETELSNEIGFERTLLHSLFEEASWLARPFALACDIL